MEVISPPNIASREPKYSVSVDQVQKDEWEFRLSDFADASIYQTWSYGMAHHGQGKTSHLVVSRDQRVIGLAQVRIVQLPLAAGGVAYVSRGPVWQRKGESPALENLRQVGIALRTEYAERRGLYLKLAPNLFANNTHPAMQMLEDCGYRWSPSRYRTLLIDLSPSLDELRTGLRQTWRSCLRKAENAGLKMVEGRDVALYDRALAVHREMHQRKGYAEFVNMEEFRVMQEQLPDALKMWIVLCEHEGETVSALGWSVFGEIGLPLICATRKKGLEIHASHLMFWRMIQWLKERGYRYCDLGGIGPERNPEGYTFKAGLAKGHGMEASLLGEFDFCENGLSRLAYETGSWARKTVRSARLAVERYRKKRRQRSQESRSISE